ncbi:MAG: DNA polymerase III subunit alpha [bacterium]|nr:DNA polymerase III subunit alpha [bacterium]
MSDFVHLHNHSEYSLLDGLSKIPEMVARCQELGMKAIALTDHGVMHGVVPFYLACRDAKIKPIIGCEVYVAQRSRFDKQSGIDSDQYHLVLLARNDQGYKNLMKLVTVGHLEGFYYKPRIDIEALKLYSDGLIGLSACIEGEIPSLLRNGEDEKAEKKAKELSSIFGSDNFYLEIQNHPKIDVQEKTNKKMVSLSRRVGLPLVATNDFHYVYKDDAEAQEALLCIQTKTTLDAPNRKLSMINSPDFYMRTPEEMRGLFIEYPEAVENTVKIASLCEVSIPMEKWILPQFSVPDGETPESYLKKLTLERLPQRFSKITPEIEERTNYELDVICKKKFATYFLIVQDLVNWAKGQGIRVGPGRGSAPGSLVSYLLRITSIDPLYHNLPFERFLNPDRPSPPDIDLDFADDRRDEVIAYVTNKYGKDRVAQIITFGKMEARQAVRDVGRVMGLPYTEPDKIAKSIPFGMNLSTALETVVELQNFYQEPKYRRLLELARKLEGVSRNASTHAAGVVISDQELTSYAPLQKEVAGERIITQYDMYSLDVNVSGAGRAIGLLKMDFLGLRNLTILEKALKYVRDRQGKEIDLSDIPLDQPEVYSMISRGETTGVFQLESSGMRRLAQNLKPAKFSDLSAMVALFRPGPMDWIDDFIEAKNNSARIRYPHPDLKSILAETYGIALYQDQCLQIASLFAGFSVGEADNLRRAIGKKKRDIMDKEKGKFLERAVEKGYKRETAEKVFNLIERFAGYGFNKAHATSYAMIAYQTAWMKVNFPVEFMAAVLTAESGAGSGPARDEKTAQAVEECRRTKLTVLPPDVNKSEVGFNIEMLEGKETIRFGLSAIKNVGTAAIDSILAAKNNGSEFKSLVDFCRRIDLQKVNKKTLESMIKAGAMDEFGTRAALLSAMAKIIEESHREQKRVDSGQTQLFSDTETDGSSGGGNFELPQIEEFSRLELLAFEKELLGFYLSDHPLSDVLDILEEEVSCPITELAEREGQTVTIGGIISAIRKITTKKANHEMAFVTIEDKTGKIDLVVFPKIWEETRLIWIKDQVVVVTGRVEQRERGASIREHSFIVERARPLRRKDENSS